MSACFAGRGGLASTRSLRSAPTGIRRSRSAQRPDYPARLDVVYPERLSRGLALVKWWLLADTAVRDRRLPPGIGGGSAVQLGGFGRRADRRARPVCRRRAALHRPLPPGHLRPGGRARSLGAARRCVRRADDRPLPAIPTRYGRHRARRPARDARGRAGRGGRRCPRAPLDHSAGWCWWYSGSLAALLAFGLATAAAPSLVVDHTQRDGDGYLMSPNKHLSTGTYALVSKPTTWAATWSRARLPRHRAHPYRERPASVRRHRPVGRRGRLPGRHAPRGGQRHRSLARQLRRTSGWPRHPHRPARRPSGPPPPPGSGEQVLDWKPSGGTWRVVVMNADGSPRVTVDASVGAKLDNWSGSAPDCSSPRLVLAFAAAGLIHLGIRRSKAPAQP